MREKLYAFMYGRYGVDTLNIVLMGCCLTAFLLNIFITGVALRFVGYGIWLLVIFRMFSKQAYKRNQENKKFMQIISPLTRRKKLYQTRKQDPTHKYYRCSSCQQIVRLPKGRGKVVVKCPKCQHQFEKRT